MTSLLRWVITATVLGSIGATTAVADDAFVEYVVKPGDTCVKIADQQLGNRRAYRTLHRLNPGLGPEPHLLVPGTVLRLPPRGADAQLSGAHGTVRVRDPVQSDWAVARRGMELFRAWRVNTADRSTAEVRFRDDSRLGLRENTIVIVYGPIQARARNEPSEAMLDRGTLRSRIGELSAVKVRMPSGEAELTGGSAVIEVSDAGTTAVSNHRGRAVRLRGSSGAAVAVAAGMGTRAEPGRPPERPRLLPPAPRWTQQVAAIGAVEGIAAIEVAWDAVPEAASYRVEFVRGDDVVGTTMVAAGDPLAARLAAAPPGNYTVRVAARTRDGLEGRPALHEVTVFDVVLVEPGADPPRFPRAFTPAPSALAAVAVGGRVHAYGAACAVVGSGGAAFDRLGPVAVQCTTATGVALPSISVDVIDVTAAIDHESAAPRATLTLVGGSAIGPRLALSASPGIVLTDIERTAAGFTFALRRLDPATPGWIGIRDEATGIRVATLPFD